MNKKTEFSIGEDIPETITTTVSESVGPTIWPTTISGLLIDRWERLWDRLNGLPRTGFFETMISRYTDPHRHYHTLVHLSECFDAFDFLSHHCDHLYQVEMAIWFHDAIYDPSRQDNEVKSAELAFSSLTESGVELLCANRISKLVVSTDHRHPPNTVDAAILADVDLSILGASEDRFQEYEKQIRWEYSHIADGPYIKGRTRFIEKLLNRFHETGHLYFTPEFKQHREPQAVANLESSLINMAAGILPTRMPKMDSFEDERFYS